ncbi:hypothetical protein QTN47_15245 [Danxiaibacter flavus]|uniref:Uncharacterized protein n=1 Tax=Danxiaibacter flavus TaxID=3049108 RepID=A0ABV3ZG54_9BACT|nr:hypothetical protein QNM32_15255 [Chitinophagaceae bacterium DXS]
MKRILLFFSLITTLENLQAQNTFPATGSVGIGTTMPRGKLHVVENARDYYVDRMIPGSSEDSQGPNYLLLHEIYSGTLLDDRHVMGKLTAIRGNTGSWNRKWTVEVNTSSAYNANRGSMITYNEAARLVTLTYNNVNYLAVEINNSSALYYFSFTGYAHYETLSIVKDEFVSNVQPFVNLDPITTPSNIGIGTTNPAGKLSFADVDKTNLPNGITWYSGSGDPTVYGVHRTAGDWVAPNYQQLRLGWTTGVVIDPGTQYGKSYLDVQGNGLRVTQGSLGIGTTDTKGYKLAVNGAAVFTKAVVKNYANWPDYVFDSAYNLPSLESVSSFVKENRHLPEIPSASTIEKDGHDLGDVQKMLLKKVEELTLYIIDQNGSIKDLRSENEALRKRIEQIEQQVVNHN